MNIQNSTVCLRCLQVMLLIGQMLTAPGEDFCFGGFAVCMEGEEDEAAVDCGPRVIPNLSVLSPKQVQPLYYGKTHRERGEPWRANKCPGMYEIHPPLSKVSGSPWLPPICLSRMKLVFAGRRRRIKTLTGSASGLQHCQPVGSWFV